MKTRASKRMINPMRQCSGISLIPKPMSPNADHIYSIYTFLKGLVTGVLIYGRLERANKREWLLPMANQY